MVFFTIRAYLLIFVGHGGTLLESMPLGRKVVGSNLALAATPGTLGKSFPTQQNQTMIKKEGLQTAAEERQRQSKEFRMEAARQSIPKRRTNNGKAPALGRSQPNPGHDQITLLSRTERPAARQR